MNIITRPRFLIGKPSNGGLGDVKHDSLVDNKRQQNEP